MKRFVFAYEALLRQREAAEVECQRRLGAVLSQRGALEAELRRMQDVIRGSKRDLTASLVGRVDLAAVGQVARYTAHATQRGHVAVRELAQLEHQATQARAALVEARRAVKALQLLRENQHEAWKRDAARREAIALDELAGQRFTRGGAA